MVRVAFLAAMPTELRPLARMLSLRRTALGGRPAYTGVLGDIEVVAAVTGMGPANATETTEWLLDAVAVDHLVNVGVAGGVSPKFKVRDLVMPERVVDRATGEEFRPAPLGGHVGTGTLLTGADLEVDRAVHAALARDGVVALDMETAAIARACAARRVPWSVFRALSDHVDDELVDEAVLGLARADGSPDAGAVLRYVLRRPWHVTRLARLGRDTSAATTMAARAAVEAVRSGFSASS